MRATLVDPHSWGEPPRSGTDIRSYIISLLQLGLRGAARCCTGCFTELVAGDAQNSEAPTLLRERLEIGLDKNLTFSSLEEIRTRSGASPKSTSWRRPFLP